MFLDPAHGLSLLVTVVLLGCDVSAFETEEAKLVKRLLEDNFKTSLQLDGISAALKISGSLTLNKVELVGLKKVEILGTPRYARTADNEEGKKPKSVQIIFRFPDLKVHTTEYSIPLLTREVDNSKDLAHRFRIDLKFNPDQCIIKVESLVVTEPKGNPNLEPTTWDTCIALLPGLDSSVEDDLNSQIQEKSIELMNNYIFAILSNARITEPGIFDNCK